MESHGVMWLCVDLSVTPIDLFLKNYLFFTGGGGSSINVCCIKFTWMECNTIEAIQSAECISHTQIKLLIQKEFQGG